MYTYSYLIADVVMLCVWVLLFMWRKDVRKTMIWFSLLFGIIGLLVEYTYTIDWWRPLTITHTRVGLEDFLFGFWIAGIAAVIYEEVFKKRIYRRKQQNNSKAMLLFSFLVGSVGLLFYGSFYLLKVNSFYASLVGLVPAIMLVWFMRRDLIPDSLLTGILLVSVGFLWFWIPEYITPGWVKHYWLFQNLSGIMILKAPLEDFMWGFLVGAFIGPLYEIWQGAKLIPLNKKINSHIRKH